VDDVAALAAFARNPKKAANLGAPIAYLDLDKFETEDDYPDHDGGTFARYVTTDGGFLIPHESGIQDAKLVRMEVGESGWPLLRGV
jgi:hypothetical protein